MAKKPVNVHISERISNILSLPNRTITLPINITSKSFSDFAQCMNILEADNQEQPIIINVCNMGGNTDVATAMIARMESSPCIIHTYAMGTVCSAALYIFMAGDVRYSHILTNFMHHQPSVGFDRSNFDAISHDIKHFEQQFMQICAWMANRSKKTRDFWYKTGRSGKDFYFTAQDAVDFGICERLMHWSEKD